MKILYRSKINKKKRNSKRSLNKKRKILQDRIGLIALMQTNQEKKLTWGKNPKRCMKSTTGGFKKKSSYQKTIKVLLR